MALKDLTPAQREQATNAYPTMSVTQIAQQLGVSYHSIRELMHEVGAIRSRPTGKKRVIPTDGQRQSIVELYRAGSTTKELTEQFSLCSHTVRSILREAGASFQQNATSQQKEYAVQQYLLGRSTQDIGDEIGYCSAVVRDAVKTAGIKIRPSKKTTPESEKDIVERYEAGESSNSIAERLGIGASLVLRVLNQNGVKRRGRITCEKPDQPLFRPKFDPLQLPDFKYPGIYKFTNLINGKVYIGQAQNINRRYYRHAGNGQKSGLFPRALKKYGIGNFDFEVLERVDDLSKLNEREQYWMDFYNAYDKKVGYNVYPIAGSSRGYKRSPDLVESIRQKLKGKYVGELSPNYGRKASPEARARMSAARLSLALNKPVAQINTLTGEVIKTWPSSKAAALETGIANHNIQAVCRGYRINSRTKQKHPKNSHGGYKWQYVYDNPAAGI